MAINIADKLHAATAEGVVADATEIDGLAEFVEEHAGGGQEDIAFADMVSASRPNVIYIEGGIPSVRTGRTKVVGTTTYYEWKVVNVNVADPSFVYTTIKYPNRGDSYVFDTEVNLLSDDNIIERVAIISLDNILNAISASETAIKQAMPTDYAKAGSIGNLSDGDTLATLLYQVKNNTSLTAAQADADWQNVKPITE